MSQAEPWGKKLPAKFTPLIKAIIIGLGKRLSLTIAAKIGKRIIVTGVPARKADKSEEIPSVINTARKMLSFITFPKADEINSENPNSVKELDRINKMAKTIIIFHEMSLFISEKLRVFLCIISNKAADTIATREGANPININTKEPRTACCCVRESEETKRPTPTIEVTKTKTLV